MKCRVINLDYRVDRWERMKKEMENIKSVKMERVSGIRERDVSGYINCGMSHIKIIEESIKKGEGNILIMEDDCWILDKRNFDERWEKIRRYLDEREDWDIFLGGALRVEPIEVVDEELRIVRIRNQSTMHFAYINRRCFDKIIGWDKKNAIDRLYRQYEDMVYLTTEPYLCVQHKDYSDISEKKVDFHKSFRICQERIEKFIKDKNI